MRARANTNTSNVVFLAVKYNKLVHDTPYIKFYLSAPLTLVRDGEHYPIGMHKFSALNRFLSLPFADLKDFQTADSRFPPLQSSSNQRMLGGGRSPG
jgi:hypothetical protein